MCVCVNALIAEKLLPINKLRDGGLLFFSLMKSKLSLFLLDNEALPIP